MSWRAGRRAGPLSRGRERDRRRPVGKGAAGETPPVIDLTGGEDFDLLGGGGRGRVDPHPAAAAPSLPPAGGIDRDAGSPGGVEETLGGGPDSISPPGWKVTAKGEGSLLEDSFFFMGRYLPFSRAQMSNSG